MKKQLFLFFLFFFTSLGLQSQIAGSFTVPGSFPTLAAAINTLNITGVAGAVTINVMAGYTETVPVGGLRLINPPGSSVTTISFKKIGLGSNPLLMAYSGGTATPSSNQKDGIWMLVDCHNVTIDAIDLIDQNTTTPATMEFGYGFYKNTSGTQNNIIRNCSITLSAPISYYSCGIELSCNHYLNNTTSVVPTSSLQTNSFNTFHSNLIKNCDMGIAMNGYGANSYFDQGNDVGGLSAVTGNTVVNFGGNASSPATGIYANNQFQFNASFNIINSNNGSGALPTDGVNGIYVHGVGPTINSNTISLTATGGLNSQLVGISQTNNFISTATVNINNNIFPSLSYTATSISVSSHSIISANGNDNVYVNNNQIGNFTSNTGTVNLISVTSGIAGGNSSIINNNSISGATVSAQGGIIGIYSTTNQQQINNNSLGNFLAPGTSTVNYASVYGINVPTGVYLTVSGNTVTNVYGTNLYGISITSSVSVATHSITNNQIMNFGSAPSNTVGSTSCGICTAHSSTISGVMTVISNTVSNLTGAKIGSSAFGGRIAGIECSLGANSYVSKNKIYDLSSSGSYGVYGIDMDAAQNYIYNNLVGSLNISSNGNISVLNLDGAGVSKVHFNSFYLNTSTSTSTIGTNLISSVNNSVIELRNNILVNTSTGSGVPAILVVNNILPTSNNNAFYFGNTGRISRSIPSSSVIAGYRSVYNSDSQSFVENPPFVSTIGANTNFLNINPTIATQIESGAVSISTITTDFINAVRSATPDVGAWEGNYTAADIASPVIVNSGFTAPPCNSSSRTFTANITDVSGVAMGSLAPRLYYRVNFGLYTSVQGTLISGSATNGTWSFTLNYSANLNDVIWHFLVMQDVSYLSNVYITPSTSASVTDVNNVSVPPNPAYSYTIQTNPTISLAITNATICAGQSYVISASGASSYSYLPGNSATVSPVANTTYTVSGTSSLGCPSTNTLSLNIATIPSPTITVNSGSICAGQSFTMIPSGGSSYLYQGGSAVVSPLSTSLYTVTGSAVNGCSGNATAQITVFSLPIMTVTATQNTVCIGGIIHVTAAGANSYTWQPGTQSGSVYTNTILSTTTLTVQGSNLNGCLSTANITVFTDNCTGVEELKNELFKLWPNPTNGNLYIYQESEVNKLLILIKDVTGQTIVQNKTTLQLSCISLFDYADGIYLVEVYSDDIIISRSKLILSH